MKNPLMMLRITVVYAAFALAAIPGRAAESDVEGQRLQTEARTASVSDTAANRTPPAVDGIFSAQYGKLLLRDLAYTVASPADWNQDEWRRAGIAGATVLGIGILLDHRAYDRSVRMRQRENEQRAKQFERFGTPQFALGVAGVFYLAGLNGNEQSMFVAQDSLAASLITSAVAVPVLKFVIGRRRPHENEGSLSLKPFNDKNSSFPSGHSAQAFALASAVAGHHDSPWVNGLAYGLASLTALSRVYHGAHFASDVAAGALLGTYIGNTVVRYNNRGRDTRVAYMPVITPQMTGLAIRMEF